MCSLASRTGSRVCAPRLAVAGVRDDENEWLGGQLVEEIDVGLVPRPVNR